MPNEVDNLVQGEVAEPQAAPSPSTLAEAFVALRDTDKLSAAEPVGEQTADIAASPAEPDQSIGGSEPEPSVGEADAQGNDEFESNLNDFDPNPARRVLLQQANAYAQQAAQKMFADQGVRLMDIQDIYEKDERNGRVIFRNPDDPDRPFNSRYEAQQYIDSINKQINSRWQKELRVQQQKALQSMAPQFALIEYAPTYNAMTQEEKDIFDMLIDPYAITDAGGNVIGFNVNLQAFGNQAKAIAKKFANRVSQTQPTEAKEKKPASTPALDMQQATGVADDSEPQTLEDAMKKIKEMRKGK